MLTLGIPTAVLQGLPARVLDIHEPSLSSRLRKRFEYALKHGAHPASAVSDAIKDLSDRERSALQEALSRADAVLRLPGLTSRQKEVLLVLRSLGTASLPQLSRILALDRSYTRRLLEVLIEKGYAIKYFRRDGTYYLATSSPMSDQARFQITELMQAFKQALFEQQNSRMSSSPKVSVNAASVSPESRESPESPKSRKSTESPISPESRVSLELRMTAAAQEAVTVPNTAQPDAWPPLPRKGTSNATGAFPIAPGIHTRETHSILALDITMYHIVQFAAW